MTHDSGDDKVGTENAILLAQAEERLRQERLMANESIARARAFRRLQVSAGWTGILMLPAMAIFCVVVLMKYETVPGEMTAAASGALFVDVLGVVVAAYRSWAIKRAPDEPLKPVTKAPVFERH
ncbi:hypothetical protein ACIP4S_16490 [Streptomyces chartreusis]|uniref:hypothetical protein n=1 Tax=Streptomyces chartreusis TaxID=1969 RepID=UPI00382CE0F5